MARLAINIGHQGRRDRTGAFWPGKTPWSGWRCSGFTG